MLMTSNPVFDLATPGESKFAQRIGDELHASAKMTLPPWRRYTSDPNVSIENQRRVGHAQFVSAVKQAEPLEQLLDRRRAELKVRTAAVAMHISEKWRLDLFRQLDDLMDIESWHLEDQPIDPESFMTFLRFLIYEKNIKRPSLAISTNGAIIAAWFEPGQRLTIEFHAKDHVRWIVSRVDEQFGSESAAGTGSVLRLAAVLSPYGAEAWFKNAAAA
ncbi:MAG TPA: hypothetical protein VMH36_08715 [Alphaproteobacteria bacterium]|nr:hypothetical protein [Alphaproteobacteria bacterium]